MRRIALLVLVVLGAVILMQAQNSTTGGTICQSTCVTKVENVSTCDVSCADKSGETVLVDDQGKVMTIVPQKTAMPQTMAQKMAMPKKSEDVKVVPSEKEREQTLRNIKLTQEAGGG